jgi:hypothetical protein
MKTLLFNRYFENASSSITDTVYFGFLPSPGRSLFVEAYLHADVEGMNLSEEKGPQDMFRFVCRLTGVN